MPIISRFHGIVIRMYFFQTEHNPPHIHAIYGDEAASTSINGGSVLDGHLPPKALSLVQEWVSLNKNELMAIWNTQDFKPIKPLE